MSATKGPEYIIRRLKLSDCEEVRELWTDVGFQIIKYINEVMINYKTNGVFVAQELKTGKLIGVLSGFNISPELAFIGQYIVKRDYQGLGIGPALWERVMAFTGTQTNLALISEPEMVVKYRDKSNFKVIPGKIAQYFYGIAQVDDLIETIPGITLNAINDNNIKAVIEYDKHICEGLDRTVYIQHTCKAPETVSLVAMNPSNEVMGYCFLLPTNIGTLIVGPLYANNEKIAELLIGKCLKMSVKSRTKRLLYITWDSNHKSVDIAKRMGLEVKTTESVMFTKNIVDGDMSRIFCISCGTYYPF